MSPPHPSASIIGRTVPPQQRAEKEADVPHGERPEGERIVAEQDVVLRDRHTLKVRISEHPDEEFWRVDVAGPSEGGRSASATVAAGDSFLKDLIDRAVGGEKTAWRHLAAWGEDNLRRPVPGVRAGPARVTR